MSEIKHLCDSGMKPRSILTSIQCQEFSENGFLLIKNFYDKNKYISPLIHKIYNFFEIINNKFSLGINVPAYSAVNFDKVYYKILVKNRSIASLIYDMVKQLPEFIYITALPQNLNLAREIFLSSNTAMAGKGSGIRINNPREDKFLANWHQEYSAQLHSPRGIVFWSPLVQVTKELGPVVVCPGSHKQGIYPITVSENTELPSAYGISLFNEKKLLNQFSQISPITSPGDLLIMDFLTLHRSGTNKSASRALWSMQFRYYNLDEPEGQKIQWRGPDVNGTLFKEMHSDLVKN